MIALLIIGILFGLAIFAAIGIVCGRICADIIRFKNKNQSEVLWFWLGFIFNWLGIVLTLVVKENKE